MSLRVVLVSLFSLVSAVEAFAISITDNFVGGTPTRSSYYGVDVIGDINKFSVEKMDVNVSGGMLNVSIFSTYFDNVGELNTFLGDLFISTNGWSPYGSAPYKDDTASNGETWEYVLKLDNSLAGLGANGTASLYNVNQAQILLSDAFNNPNSVIYRGNQEVGYNPLNQQALGFGSYSIVDLAGGTDVLTFSISLASLGLAGDANLGFHWTMSCGNDVIEGGAQVPEPSTLALLALGSFGFIRRRTTSEAKK